MTKSKSSRHPRAGRPTAEQAKKRHQELLEKALDLFLKKGFELTTLDAIAAAMHMTKRTIYGLYSNKEALFKAAVQQAIDNTRISFEQLRDLERNDLESTLSAVARLRINTFLSPTGLRLQRVLNAESYRFPELTRLAYEQGTRPSVEFLMDLFARHAESGTLENIERPEATATIFLSMAVGAPARGILSGANLWDSISLDDHITYCVRLFLNGIRKR